MGFKGLSREYIVSMCVIGAAFNVINTAVRSIMRPPSLPFHISVPFRHNPTAGNSPKIVIIAFSVSVEYSSAVNTACHFCELDVLRHSVFSSGCWVSAECCRMGRLSQPTSWLFGAL